MRRIVLDTNCLLAILPAKSPYHRVWTDFLEERIVLCFSNEILAEYEEIISEKTSPLFANNIIKTILNKNNTQRVVPTWRFNLIQADPDDNKFVDCAICGEAEVIVSNDKHFKELDNIPFPFVIHLTLQEFVKTL